MSALVKALFDVGLKVLAAQAGESSRSRRSSVTGSNPSSYYTPTPRARGSRHRPARTGNGNSPAREKQRNRPASCRSVRHKGSINSWGNSIHTDGSRHGHDPGVYESDSHFECFHPAGGCPLSREIERNKNVRSDNIWNAGRMDAWVDTQVDELIADKALPPLPVYTPPAPPPPSSSPPRPPVRRRTTHGSRRKSYDTPPQPANGKESYNAPLGERDGYAGRCTYYANTPARLPSYRIVRRQASPPPPPRGYPPAAPPSRAPSRRRPTHGRTYHTSQYSHQQPPAEARYTYTKVPSQNYPGATIGYKYIVRTVGTDLIPDLDPFEFRYLSRGGIPDEKGWQRYTR